MKQRFSRKREAIYSCLRSTDSHPTAEWIYQQLQPTFPDLSLATVYRNLAQMKAAGQIQSVGVVSGSERFEAVVEPHTHFICTKCHQVMDFHAVTISEQEMEAAEAASGFKINSASLWITGLCPNCRKEPT